MNRDESRFRAAEEPPRVFGGGGRGSWIMPVDGESKGTWMGANDSGVVACLLNGYLPQDTIEDLTRPSETSRGTIIPALLEEGSWENVLRYMQHELDTAQFASFILMAMSPEGSRVFRWHPLPGLESWPLEKEWDMVTSAFFDMAAVHQWRSDAFRRWEGEGHPQSGYLPDFHLYRSGEEGLRSTLVDKEYGCTRSITQVEVNGDGRYVEMRYWPESTVESAAPATVIRLALK